LHDLEPSDYSTLGRPPSEQTLSPWYGFNGPADRFELDEGTLDLGIEPDLPAYKFTVTCTVPGRETLDFCTVQYENALELFRQTDVCGGTHTLDVQRA